MAETRVALVTGANRGIGLEVARQLARLGIMAVVGSRSLEKGRAAIEPLASEGLITPVVALDVTDAASVQAAVAEVMGLFGRIDILVNNAGILIDGPGSPISAVKSIPPDVVRDTYETNAIGPLRLIQAVLPMMRDQAYGRIVNVSSGAGQLSDMGAEYPAYRMSKSALNALTRTAAAELGNGPIKINAVCPGWVRTDLGGQDAPRTVAEGAETPVWLATLDDSGPTGGFFRDKKPIPW
jgi:NAD(P)-dependent dehydrogenase (short-subunit alcohol dehydrogenase family)